ncbi:unnamed protein product [Pylaiella littoralis]
MWVTALQSVRTEGVFTQSLFVQENDVWSVRIDECIKLLATMFFFKYEAAFARGERTAGNILECVHGSIENYVDVIRFIILSLGSKRATATCPGVESLHLQSERGWGVDPKTKGDETKDLTAQNCVSRLSEHSYIGPNRKTKTLTCGCNLDLPLH